MSSEHNKAVVRQFKTEVLSGGNVDAVDKLLAPNYANPSAGITNRDGFKGMVTGLKAALPTRGFEVKDVVAEGASVVFRGNMHMTFADGKKVTARIITFYRLAGGLIVEDEPISSPPLSEFLPAPPPPK